VFRLQPGDYRQQFAAFLERLANAAVGEDEWSSFVVTHYPHQLVEETRRQCVRLAAGYLEQELDTPEGKRLLLAWAAELQAR
jgi:hypothetical protein